jgi:hypothetical protein
MGKSGAFGSESVGNLNRMKHNRRTPSIIAAMRSAAAGALFALALATPSLAQAPRPFPGATLAPPPPTPITGPATAARQTPAPAPAAPGATQPQTAVTGPPASVVGFTIYPGSQFFGSYDAGKGQRYYLFGTTAPYMDVVTFYRTQLKDRGVEVFTEPPTHMFHQRFREETMAFPPGVTVKDWTYQSRGYPNPRLGAQPERFPTVLMIVPPPPAAPPAR